MDVTLWLMAKEKKETPNREALEELRKRLKRSLRARVKSVREDMHYDPKDVLNELERHGVARTQGSLSQIENGLRLPSVEALFVLARFLGTSTDYLLGLSDNGLSAADIEEELATARGGTLDAILLKLPREQRSQILAFAEFMLARYTAAEDNLTQRQRDDIRAEQAIASIEKEFGVPVRIELEKIIRAKGVLASGSGT